MMDNVTSDRHSEMQAGLLDAARALDDGSPDLALLRLRTIPLVADAEPARIVALALWKNLVRTCDGKEPLPCQDTHKALAALDDLGAAVADERHIWPAYRAFPLLEKQVGSANAAAAVAAILWARILKAHEGVFVAAFELLFRAGDVHRCREAWRQFLAARKEYVPSYWHFLLYFKTQENGNRDEVTAELNRMMKGTKREDLKPLLDVYMMQMRQDRCSRIAKKARTLSDPEHRARVGEYMTGIGYMPEDLPIAVGAFRHLMKKTRLTDPALGFMEARLANANREWDLVLAHAERAKASPQYCHAAELLAANALGHLREFEKARAKLAIVNDAPDAAVYLRARATFINVTIDLIEKRMPTPDIAKMPALPVQAGRPLAQSLWVGRRLRWIERLAIRSYLDNGWRFQLYTYDDVANVPEGCEVLDANAIIPRKGIFKEGFGSGLHVGSLGAFSDLFRYKLLYERGGMWTDTDVINLKRFDPDGARFISTEISDAGLITLNGAIMAAPAGHAFVERAYERACELLRADGVFFTRIGPYLLAELLLESGVDAMDLMPPNFLSAVFWMNTGDLLEPYETIERRLRERDAVNLHAYTEMWRMLGLGLDKPPGVETFLGKLYAEKFGADAPHSGSMRP